MSETIDDMKSMFVIEMGGIVVVDVSRCRLSHCKQIALLHVARRQSKIKDKARSIQIKISDTEIRHFKIPDDIGGHELQRSILSDPMLLCFDRV